MTQHTLKTLTLCLLALVMAASGCRSQYHSSRFEQEQRQYFGVPTGERSPAAAVLGALGHGGGGDLAGLALIGGAGLLVAGLFHLASPAVPPDPREQGREPSSRGWDINDYCAAGLGRPDPSLEVPEYLKSPRK